MRPHFKAVLDELQLLPQLREFQPTIIGTPPLGIDVSTSDIDVACVALDLGHFADFANSRFGDQDRFSKRTTIVRTEPTVMISFWYRDWQIELFCQTCPVEDQWGVRHFNVERRLLELGPELGPIIKRLKLDGLKTEPAFAKALGLTGDAHKAILELEQMQDNHLSDLVARSFIDE